MNKEGFGSQNSMALAESATVDGKDMQTSKCLVTKATLRECCKELSSAFCVGNLGYPLIIEVRAQGSGVLNHTPYFHSYLNSKLLLKLIGKASTLGKKQKLKISRRRHIVLISVPIRTVT